MQGTLLGVPWQPGWVGVWGENGYMWAPQEVLEVKKLPANAGDGRDSSARPGSGRAPGKGNDNPL